MSHPHHREVGRASDKSQWGIPEDDECHVFCGLEAQQPHEVAASNQVWAVTDDLSRPFGTRGELLARFFPPALGSSDWHGHPVGKESPGTVRSAPPAVITAWETAGLIKHALARKLRKQAV